MQLVWQSLEIILRTNHFYFVHGSNRPLSIAPPHDQNRVDIRRGQYHSFVQKISLVVTHKDQMKMNWKLLLASCNGDKICLSINYKLLMPHCWWDIPFCKLQCHFQIESWLLPVRQVQQCPSTSVWIRSTTRYTKLKMLQPITLFRSAASENFTKQNKRKTFPKYTSYSIFSFSQFSKLFDQIIFPSCMNPSSNNTNWPALTI